jgi:hypothetical protein
MDQSKYFPIFSPGSSVGPHQEIENMWHLDHSLTSTLFCRRGWVGGHAGQGQSLLTLFIGPVSYKNSTCEGLPAPRALVQEEEFLVQAEKTSEPLPHPYTERCYPDVTYVRASCRFHVLWRDGRRGVF